jgi:tRNA (guanine26-N2/guanine27-N2)-dimethyltransferase
MKEVDVHVNKILANDWDLEAAELIKRNFEFNNIEAERTEVTAMDAMDLMYERRKLRDFYDVIDIDPYGTAAPFLDSAIQAVENGGMI